MKFMKSFAIAMLFIVSTFLIVNTVYAFGYPSGPICVLNVSKADADHHRAGQPLKGKVGDSGKHLGESTSAILPIDKSFHQLKKGDLIYSHGVVHSFVSSEKQSDGSYKVTFHPTKLIIDQKKQLK